MHRSVPSSYSHAEQSESKAQLTGSRLGDVQGKALPSMAAVHWAESVCSASQKNGDGEGAGGEGPCTLGGSGEGSVGGGGDAATNVGRATAVTLALTPPLASAACSELSSARMPTSSVEAMVPARAPVTTRMTTSMTTEPAVTRSSTAARAMPAADAKTALMSSCVLAS